LLPVRRDAQRRPGHSNLPWRRYRRYPSVPPAPPVDYPL